IEEFRDGVGRAMNFDFVTNDVQNAADLETLRLVFVDEVNRDLDGNLRVAGNAEEVHVEREITNRVELVVLRENLVLLAADVDRGNGGHETAGMDTLRHLFGVERNRNRGLLVTVDDSGNQTVAAKFTGGPLTNPFARLGLELVSVVAHGYSFRGYMESRSP